MLRLKLITKDDIITDKTVIVHFIRHGQAYHNVHPKFKTKEEEISHYMRPVFFDARLTLLGHSQASSLLEKNLEIDAF